MSSRNILLTTEVLLNAYKAGVFPMAESADSNELHWFDPPVRAIIPLDDRFHIPRRLKRTIRQGGFTVKIDTAFSRVMSLCGEPAPDRPETWINTEIKKLFTTLHSRGYAHSVEVWHEKDLVGGLYGLAIGSAFFGESMFSRARDASKIALVYLVSLLRHQEFTLLDTQFQTDHLARFGTCEITRDEYQSLLGTATKSPNRRFALPAAKKWSDILGGTV